MELAAEAMKSWDRARAMSQDHLIQSFRRNEAPEFALTGLLSLCPLETNVSRSTPAAFVCAWKWMAVKLCVIV